MDVTRTISLAENQGGWIPPQPAAGVFLANTTHEWFLKWPEATVHFKDSETGIPLAVSQLSEQQTVEFMSNIDVP
jgi:hypothetical protein